MVYTVDMVLFTLLTWFTVLNLLTWFIILSTVLILFKLLYTKIPVK